jgi:hypothetical protein
MIKSAKWLVFCISALAWLSLGFGQEGGVKVTTTGYAAMEEGQIVKAGTMFNPQWNPKTNHIWVQKFYVGFNLQSKLDPLPIEGNVGIAMKVFNETPKYEMVFDFGQGSRLWYLTYLNRADLLYTAHNTENMNLQFEIGYFPIKYNNDVRNLGEYLFRSGTYPQYLISNFDFPAARVAGLLLKGTFFNNLHLNMLANVNTEWANLGDLNLTGILSYNIANAVEIGGGISLCSIISADMARTQPEYTDNGYQKNGDTAYYTFAGTKVMGRLSIDPKIFINTDVFGKEDLKVYSEAALLGLKNYPVSLDSFTRYDDITKRIPVMFGFNFPTFKIFDVLSLEWEWFGCVYPNDLGPIIADGKPLALQKNNRQLGYVYTDSSRDNWKWSLYGKKTFFNFFNVTFQFANDHLRWETMDYNRQTTKTEEALRQMGQWYWTAKFGYCF